MPAKPIFTVFSIAIPGVILIYVWQVLRGDSPRVGMASAMAQGLVLVFGTGLAGLVAIVGAAIALLRGERWPAVALVVLLGGIACWAWLIYTFQQHRSG